MILLEIKDFFQKYNQASILEVSKHFKIQASAAQGMIDFWVNKGCLRKTVLACEKKSCGGCAIALSNYQWVSNVMG